MPEVLIPLQNNKEFIPLNFDLLFKKVFGDNNVLGPIRYLLKVMLNLKPKKIFILNTELIERPYKDKKVEVDFIAELEDGTKISIEANTDVSPIIINRNVFYMFRNISKDIKPGAKYDKLNRHIQINFDMEGHHEEPITSYSLREDTSNEKLTDLIQIIRVDVPFFYNKCYNTDESKLTPLDKFIGLFGCKSIEDVKFLCKGDKDMEEIGKRIEEYNSDLDLIGAYDLEWDRKELERLRMEKAIKDTTKKVTEQSKIEIAKNMLKENVDINIISKVTGLNLEDIKKLLDY